MSFRRVGWVVAIALATWLEISCGQVYRPVVIPTSTTPPNPANFHAVFGISANAPYNPGTVLQVDVSGDTDIGVADMGVNPTHAAILSNHSRVFVASAGSLFEFGGVALIVMVVIGKFAGLGDGDIPRFQVLKKGFGVADAAEGVERAGADILGGEELNACTEAAETD